MKKLISTCLFMAILLSCTTAYACTIFSASDGDTVLAGNNEDWYDKDTYVWFLPAEEGKYGRAFFGFEDADTEGGMNEKGLFFDWTAEYADRALMPAEKGKLDYQGNLSAYVLETCSTVEEALGVFDTYNQPTFGYATLFLSDRTGDSATATYNRDKKQIEITGKTRFYQVHGYGEKAVKKKLEASGKVSVDIFQKALEAAQQDDITLYSNICDLKTGDIYIYNQHNFDECVQFNIHEELKEGKHMYYIPSLFPEQKPGKYDKYKPQDMTDDSAELAILVFAIVYALSLAVTVFVYIPITLLKKDALKLGFFKPKLSLLAHTAGAANAALSLWLIAALWFHGPFIVTYGISIYSQIGAYVPMLMIALTLCQIVFTVIAWLRKYWPLMTRIHYTILTISMLFVIFILYKTNILLP
jgi:hypothetical protein